MQIKDIDFTGERFGKLIVKYKAFTKNGFPYWHCECDCGNEIDVRVYSLTSGNTLSCGCLQKERAKTKSATHGGRFDRLYGVWTNIKTRCYNQNSSSYKDYGERGITMCEEWKNSYLAFKEWSCANGYDDTAEKGKCTIDRINVNGNYEPNNCRWVDAKTQANNTRANVKYKYDGKEYTLAELADKYNINYKTLHLRITRYKMSIEEALKYKK